jgi:hypothetical protein
MTCDKCPYTLHCYSSRYRRAVCVVCGEVQVGPHYLPPCERYRVTPAMRAAFLRTIPPQKNEDTFTQYRILHMEEGWELCIGKCCRPGAWHAALEQQVILDTRFKAG